jgi:hypothetical protein
VVFEVAEKKGAASIPICFVPHPVFGRSAEQCREYLEGLDPITGKPILEEIVTFLTSAPAEEKEGVIERMREREIGPDTEENLVRLFHENGWTDGLPIILPTEERVEEMLKGTSHPPDEIVGSMRPNPDHEAWSYTVEQVAINAVMAGAKKEYLPVILAVASTGTTSLFTSTNSWARMMLVNGPVRKEIGMNSGIGAMGPFCEANSTIGRAWTLISKNLGNGGRPGVNYMGTQGNNLNYNNVCIAENEENMPDGWRPFHVQKGYRAEESVVSLFAGLHFRPAMEPPPPVEPWAYTSPQHIASVIRNLRSVGPYLNYSACVLVEPLLAQDLARIYGFQTKEDLTEWLKDNTFLDVWEYFRIYPSDVERGLDGLEPYASWLKLPQGATIPIKKFRLEKPPEVPFRRHEEPISLIVLGGKTNHWYYVGDFFYLTSASIDRWR